MGSFSEMSELDKKIILAVDDESSHRFLLEKILLDYTVVSCANAKEMWARIDEKQPDLILMDVMMPDIDGFQIVANLTQNTKTSDIPVLFLSAKISGDDVSTGLEAGGYDYIKKPFNKQELKARISSALRKKKKEIELRNESITDSLTGLNNRRFFQTSLENQLAYSRRNGINLAVSLADLDHFKRVNDTYGHLAGDQCLIAFANTLQQHVRRYDIVARYGGEEFIILFPDCSKETAGTVLERIRVKINSMTIEYENQTIEFTFSAGVTDLTDFPNDLDDVRPILKLADERLYSSKKEGRNRITIK